jgi:sialic acid synthase SpsE
VDKHPALSREDEGSDSDLSLEPEEFAQMVQAVRKMEKALGGIRYITTEKESESETFRRSLSAVKDVEKGEPLAKENVQSIRPGDGLHTRNLSNVIGRKASQQIERGTPLKWSP